MRAVDLIRPSREPKAFEQGNPRVVSSVASLADIFIHLPLIAGIVNDTRRRGIETPIVFCGSIRISGFISIRRLGTPS